MTEREKYDWLLKNKDGYGRTNHGSGSEILLDCFMFNTLLDVGGGYSTYAADVLKRGYVDFAAVTDISEAPRLEQQRRGVHFHNVAAEDMQLGHYDAVTAFDVLEHFPLEVRDKAIANIYSHAKRRLIFTIGFLHGDIEIEGNMETLHHTVASREWWQDYLIPFGGRLTMMKIQQVLHTGETRLTDFFIVDKEK